MIKVIRVVVGELATNCYLIINNNKVVVVDPGGDFPLIKKHITDLNLTPVGYLITHHHFDHILALDELINEYNLEVMTSNDEFTFEALKTPGHKEDAVCYYFPKDNFILTGDTLFMGTIGRTDLEGGNMAVMKDSLQLLKLLANEVIVYPGHGPETTIGDEKEHNSWLQ